MTAATGIDWDDAFANAAHIPMQRAAVTAWVGAAERPEFRRQSALLAEAWQFPLITDLGRHHFDVIDGLAEPRHPLCNCLNGV